MNNTDSPDTGKIQPLSLHNPDVLGVTVFDLNCFSLGLTPWMNLDEDSFGTSTITSFTIASNIGRMLNIAEVESVLIEFSNETVIITPFPFDSLFLVILARRTASLWNLKLKIHELINAVDQVLSTDTGWKHRMDTPSPQQYTCNLIEPPSSLIRLSGVSIQRISLLFQDFLRTFGYPEQLLEADAKRRQMLEYLRNACAGKCEADCIEFVSRICETKNIPRIKHFLGSGFWGAAYMLMDSTVLKITRDEMEARTSASIIGKHNSCIVDIFQVYGLSISSLSAPYYFIVRENIDPPEMLSDEDTELLGLVQQILSASYRDKWIESHQEKVSDISSNRCWNIRERAVTAAMKIKQELKNSCITFSDFHQDNIGLKNGHFCIFDLSLSEGQPVSLDEIEINLNL